ncbi:hypothetical protein J7L68_09375 [bacterium]|nr:hypothetical protein [bacterium]
MKRCILFIFLFSLIFGQTGEFGKLQSLLPDSFGMVIIIDDYKSIRQNNFRWKIVSPIIDNSPSDISDETRQVNKLSAKTDALEQAAGFRFIGENLNPLIGDKTAIAFYGVGDIEFVYITHIPIMPPVLSQPRSWYEKHRDGEITYWTAHKERQGAWGGFFYNDGTLVISNSPKQFERALALALRKSNRSIANDDNTQKSLNISRFPDENSDAAIVLNTEILKDDSYYKRYYQGADPKRLHFSRVSFAFGFDSKNARITRASLLDKFDENISNRKLGKFIESIPENAFSYEEFTVSNWEKLNRKIPFAEYFDHSKKCSITRAGCVWVSIENDENYPIIAPLVFLEIDGNPKIFIDNQKDYIAKAIADTAIPDYKPIWETDNDITTLQDALGMELGFAYKIDKSTLILSSSANAIKLKFHPPKIIQQTIHEKTGLSTIALIPDKLGDKLSAHLKTLSRWQLVDSYSARRFLGKFAVPIGENVLKSIESVSEIELAQKSKNAFITEIKIKLK